MNRSSCSSLKNKKILVTAGPTWVPVDDVRVLSNISTGELGVALAKEARRCGGRVDLLLGPVGGLKVPKGIRVLRFTYFDDLRCLVIRRLRQKKYDLILHAAAVSDYLCRRAKGKISSRRASWELRLYPAPKIISMIRRLQPSAQIVSFKLESGVSDAVLRRRASEALRRTGADLVVANASSSKRYRGYVIDRDRVLARGDSRRKLAHVLMRILAQKCA